MKEIHEQESTEKIDQIFKIWGSIGKPQGHQIFYIKLELTPENENKEKSIINFIVDLLRIYTRNRVYEYVFYAKTWFFGKAYLSIIVPIKWFSQNEISWKELASRIQKDIQTILKLKVAKIFNGFVKKLIDSYPKFMKILRVRVVFFLRKFGKIILNITKTKNEKITITTRDERNMNMKNIGNLIENNIGKELPITGFT